MSDKGKRVVITFAISSIMLSGGFIAGRTSTFPAKTDSQQSHTTAEIMQANKNTLENLQLSTKMIENALPVTAKLTHAKIALFTTSHAQVQTVNRVKQLLKSSGATITSAVMINDVAYADDRETQNTSIVNHTLPMGATINPHFNDSGERLGAELSWLALHGRTTGGISPAERSTVSSAHSHPHASTRVSPTHRHASHLHSGTTHALNIATNKNGELATSHSKGMRSGGKDQSNIQHPPAHSVPALHHKDDQLSKSSPSIVIPGKDLSDDQYNTATQALVDNQLITVMDGTLRGEADYAVFVTGDGFNSAQTFILAGIGNGLAERGQGVVLASPSANNSSPIAALRSMPTYRHRVTTVDNSDSSPGIASIVLSIHRSNAGGQYGTAHNASQEFPHI